MTDTLADPSSATTPNRLEATENGITIMLLLAMLGAPPVLSLNFRGYQGVALALVAVLGLVAFSFSSLQITVRDGRLKVTLGHIFTVQDVAVADIATVRKASPSVLSGLGIRQTPTGVLYAVNLGDALEIQLRHGFRFYVCIQKPALFAEQLSRQLKVA